MITERYRVEDKENITLNGQPCTNFALFEKRGDRFVRVGSYAAPGWDRSDAQCIAHTLEAHDDDED